MVRQKKEESVPVQEIKTPVILSVKHFSKSVLIVLLSFFCVFIGVLIYQFSQPVDEMKSVQPNHPQINTMMETKSPRKSVLFRHAAPPEKVLKVEEQIPVPTPDIVPVPQEREEKELPPVALPVVPEEPAVLPEPVAPAPIPTEPLLSLENALQLRDHLAAGQSCLADLKIIMKARLSNANEKDRLVEKLMPVCTVRSVFDSIEDTFYKNRKKALMTYYRLNNPTWLAYLKAFGASLVDVRRLEPLKEKPKDIISMAQNDLNMKNLAGAIQKIQKLPSEMQMDFNEFMGLADTYLVAQKEAENLILSFGRKGE